MWMTEKMLSFERERMGLGECGVTKRARGRRMGDERSEEGRGGGKISAGGGAEKGLQDQGFEEGGAIGGTGVREHKRSCVNRTNNNKKQPCRIVASSCECARE